MYNGIGLQTPRGSGTNGYIQRNLSHLPGRKYDLDKLRFKEPNQPPKIIASDQKVLLHKRKRAIEGELLLLQIEMEDAGKEGLEVETLISVERRKRYDAITAAGPLKDSNVRDPNRNPFIGKADRSNNNRPESIKSRTTRERSRSRC